jgi:hypothetical protein
MLRWEQKNKSVMGIALLFVLLYILPSIFNIRRISLFRFIENLLYLIYIMSRYIRFLLNLKSQISFTL